MDESLASTETCADTYQVLCAVHGTMVIELREFNDKKKKKKNLLLICSVLYNH